MFEVPGSDVVAVTVDKDTVLGTSTPTYTYSASESQEDLSTAQQHNPAVSQKKKAL